MAKTLNQFLEGYLKVKNPDEQKFVDKHVVAKHSDRNGNDDGHFKGKTKQIDRRKERHGYNPGEDEKVYEELKGGQHKIDANKNGKVDAHDFHLLRKKKKVNEASYKEGETRMGSVGPITTDAERAERAKKYREKMMKKEEAEQIDERWSENSKKTSKNLAAAALDVGNVATGGLLSKSRLAKKAMKWADSPDETTSKSSLKAYQARQARKTNEEAEQIDELSNRMLKSYAKKANKQGVKIVKTYGAALKAPGNEDKYRKMANRQDGEDLARTKLAMRREEAEQIDELSTPTLQSYRKKARAQGNAIVDKMKMGGGDWSKDQKDTKTLRKRAAGAQASGKQLVKRGESLKTEEAEQIDENAKVVAHLQKRYGDNIRKSHVRSAANDFGVGYVALAHAVRKKLGVNRLEEEQIDEISATTKDAYAKKAVKQLPGLFNKSGKDADAARKYYNRKNTVRKIANEEAELEEKINMDKASMGTVIKDFQKSDAPQFKGKSQEKRRAMAIAAKLTAERGGKPLRKEEKLADLLGDLTESHRRTMLSVFDKLNEDNQKKFLAACHTPEGVESMLDFAISHRGE